MTPLVIWNIGFLFTIGICIDSIKKKNNKEAIFLCISLLLLWPLMLGIIVEDIINTK